MKLNLQRAAFLLALCTFPGCQLKQELALAPIESVLSEKFEIDNRSAQKGAFSFGKQGEYRLRFSTSLRNGAGSSPHTYLLPVHVEIMDAHGSVRYQDSLEIEIGPNQVGGTIASFDSKDIAGTNPHQLVLTLEASDAFLAAYTGFDVWMQREPRYPLLD